MAHKMPKRPTLQERAKWHIEHAKNCKCREIPLSIKDLIRTFTLEPEIT